MEKKSPIIEFQTTNDKDSHMKQIDKNNINYLIIKLTLIAQKRNRTTNLNINYHF